MEAKNINISSDSVTQNTDTPPIISDAIPSEASSQTTKPNQEIKVEREEDGDTQINLEKSIIGQPEDTSVEKAITAPEEKAKKKALIISVVTLGLLSVTLILLYVFLIVLKAPANVQSIIDIQSSYIVSSQLSAEIKTREIYTSIPQLIIPSEPKTEESPINGELFTATEMAEMMKRRPIAVMIDNHAGARPQSNIAQADIVFETTAESGITRYMPIFWSNKVSEVGPIRSARQYYLEWLSPYDAIYSHDGCASSDDARVNACGNIWTYGIKDAATTGAWRDTSDGRTYVHAEFTSLNTIWDYAKQREWTGFPNVTSWKFKKDAKPEDRGTKSKFKMTFWGALSNGGLYDAEWKYDPDSNTYLRYVGGKADKNRKGGEQVSAKVIIVQEVKMTPTFDSAAHLIIETIGTGKAKIFQDGKMYDVTWEKKDRNSRTKYKDSEGNEFVFNRGLIWVAGLPKSQGVFKILEQ